ncbi:DNA cytosine methyltransferase [Flavobacterium sharifuzzamanii]|uniref:DNA cytosine methyltransferase n=1 Tax=Flavobacterium sharifuzzamanii TaxID=2211133 RepID=UPI000DAC50FB|nr:DNA cytosine methyltransferase [Flavobacterium sharifuzzamanii]KAF2079431.1 DNA cytosine methyltransferase [Flavobacterium sharifuzzamanii]
MKNKFTYIDLFAGCGGLSLGLHQAGWQGLFAIEKSPDAFKTLEHNLIKNKNHFNWPNWLPQQAHEINTVLDKYASSLEKLKGKVTMIAGGPPCQGFSMAGKRNEFDLRNDLINSYINFVKIVEPKIIFFENVKGFTMEFKKSKEKGIAYSTQVTQKLNDAGYFVRGQLVNFGDYGVPQKRTRFILVGIKKTLPNATQEKAEMFFESLKDNRFEFLKEKGLSVETNLQDAISDLFKQNGLKETPGYPTFQSGIYGKEKGNYQKLMRVGINDKIADSHRFPKHSTEIINRFKNILDETSLERRNFNISKIIQEKYNIKKRTVIPLNGLDKTPTITTLPDDYIHYSEPRILTVREYARIQSFPDWYVFQGKYTTGGILRTKEVPRYTQIGNAIPPLFSEQSGLVLKQLLYNG